MAKNGEQNKRSLRSLPGTSRREEYDMNTRKRSLTLDLQNKKPKFELIKDTAPVLNSPDISKFKMKSPDVEKFLSNPLTGGATPTPSLLSYTKTVTEAQENYAKGFEDALHQLQCSDSSQGNFTMDLNSNSSSSMTYTDLDPSRENYTMSPLGIVIKDEPQTVPCMTDSPRVSPIDMENQEVIKLERKRQRNRVAASKCRQRKLERISKLEDKVKILKNENSDLSNFMMKLRTQVMALKGQVMEHVNNGCQIMHHV